MEYFPNPPPSKKDANFKVGEEIYMSFGMECPISGHAYICVKKGKVIKVADYRIDGVYETQIEDIWGKQYSNSDCYLYKTEEDLLKELIVTWRLIKYGT